MNTPGVNSSNCVDPEFFETFVLLLEVGEGQLQSAVYTPLDCLAWSLLAAPFQTRTARMVCSLPIKRVRDL